MEDQLTNEQKQKRRRQLLVSRACTNCRKAHTKCDEQKPCSRCVRLGLSDTCHMAEIQKRGRKRKTEGTESVNENNFLTIDSTKKSKNPVGAATQSLQSFDKNPFNFEELVGAGSESEDTEPFIIDDFFPTDNGGHPIQQQFPNNQLQFSQTNIPDYTVYDFNYANFLLSSQLPLYAGPSCPTQNPCPMQAYSLNNPLVTSQVCQKMATAAAVQQQIANAVSQQLAQQQQLMILQQQQQQQQQTVQRLFNMQNVPISTWQQPYLNSSMPVQDTQHNEYPFSPTNSSPSNSDKIHSDINNISQETIDLWNDTSLQHRNEEEDLREQVRRLQLENEKLKNIVIGNNGPQKVQTEALYHQANIQNRFENQYLRFNEGEENVGLIVSTRDGSIISMNNTMKELLGYSDEDLKNNVSNWEQILDPSFWPKQLKWAEKNILNMQENAALSDVVFIKKGASDPPKESDLIKPKSFMTRFCYDCTSRDLLFSITKVYL